MTGLNNADSANDANISVVHAIRAKIDFTDGDGGVVTIGTVPAKAIVVDAGVAVVTAFDAGTANTADIGTAADPNGLAAAAALGTAGLIAAGALATSDDLYHTEDTDYQVTLALTGVAATAGSGYAYVSYVLGND